MKGLICMKSQKKAAKSNLGKFLRKCNFNLLQCKKLAHFCKFWTFPSLWVYFNDFWDWINVPKRWPDISRWLQTPKFWNLDHSWPRYGNFCEKTMYFAHLQSNLVILLIFFTKIAITQPKKVKIQKCLCLKSSTNIWPSFRNIYSVPKVIKI